MTPKVPMKPKITTFVPTLVWRLVFIAIIYMAVHATAYALDPTAQATVTNVTDAVSL